jgi:hypothetical protein
MIMSYVEGDLLDDPDIVSELRRHIHRLGRETNQGEIGVVLDGTYFGVTDYEEEQ